MGHDVVFGAGRFAPGTNEGRRLIAHELAHVVQQEGQHSTMQRQQADEWSAPEEEALPLGCLFPDMVEKVRPLTQQELACKMAIYKVAEVAAEGTPSVEPSPEPSPGQESPERTPDPDPARPSEFDKAITAAESEAEPFLKIGPIEMRRIQLPLTKIWDTIVEKVLKRKDLKINF